MLEAGEQLLRELGFEPRRRADLTAEKIGGPGDMVRGNGTQGVAQDGE